MTETQYFAQFVGDTEADMAAPVQPVHGAAALKDFADDAPAYAVGEPFKRPRRKATQLTRSPAATSLTAAQERLIDSIQFDGYTLEQNKWALRYSLWDGGTFIRTVPAAMVKKLVANGWLKEVPSQRKFDAKQYACYVIATR